MKGMAMFVQLLMSLLLFGCTTLDGPAGPKLGDEAMEVGADIASEDESVSEDSAPSASELTSTLQQSEAKPLPPPEVKPASKNHSWIEGEYVIISVLIDTKAEHLRKNQIEATGMLRTSAKLRSLYPDLPKNFRVPSRLRSRRQNHRTGYYTVETAFKIADVLDACKK